MKTLKEKLNESFYDNIEDYPGKGLTFFIYSRFIGDDNLYWNDICLRIAKSKDYKPFISYRYNLPKKGLVEDLRMILPDYDITYTGSDGSYISISISSGKHKKYKDARSEIREALNNAGFSDETQKIAFYIFKSKLECNGIDLGNYIEDNYEVYINSTKYDGGEFDWYAEHRLCALSKYGIKPETMTSGDMECMFGIPFSPKIKDAEHLAELLRKINIDVDEDSISDDDDGNWDDNNDDNDDDNTTQYKEPEHRCSRCGRVVPENELTWTPNGEICRDCIKKQYQNNSWHF